MRATVTHQRRAAARPLHAICLFQSLSCRPHFVKGLILLDKAGRFGGDLLELEFGRGKEIRVLGFQIACRHSGVFGVNLDPDAVAARSEGRNHRCARPTEWIEDCVTRE